MTRQREWQLKMRKQGRCVECGGEAAPSTRKGTGGRSSRCLTHMLLKREAERRRNGNVRRNFGAASYNTK